ncbi:MAG TPA: hypothetical protein VHW09_25825 [Bryobacteraceae bacterium]|jgi:hypothetical protein|nr:hypothetical protein [Bryobacteraceae bacterium]
MTPRPFRLLLKLFQDRFFESDDISPGGGFQTNIYQVMGFLLATGFIVSYFTMPVLSNIVDRTATADMGWVMRAFQLLAPTYTFAVIGFATFFEWDMLFPNRRDFLILAPFPIRLRDLFAAQIAALGKFLALLIFSVNIFPTLMAVLMAMSTRYRANGVGMVLGEIAATLGASAFVFIAIAAFQGVLLNLTSPRLFRRISPYVQMCGMSLMILSLLTLPIYMQLLRHAVETRQLWLWLLPPVWFAGLYDLFQSNAHGLFASLGVHALRMSAAALALFALTWLLGFRRHYDRTLESEDTRPHAHPARAPRLLARSTEERAIFQFSGKTLARSRKHQVFLVTYLSVGICLALNFAVVVRQNGKLALSPDGARAFPFLIAFFAISGFRAVFQFPAELPSNWLFRMTETGWTEIARLVTRKRVLLGGLAPLLLLFFPAEFAVWGVGRASFHAVFQFAAGALLIELMFWTFDKVPFTCSYFPGRTNLSILFVLYLYGFSAYSFHLADLEAAIERRPLYAAPFFAAAAVLLALSWRRHPAASAVRFDASEPTIQTLNLS